MVGDAALELLVGVDVAPAFLREQRELVVADLTDPLLSAADASAVFGVLLEQFGVAGLALFRVKLEALCVDIFCC